MDTMTSEEATAWIDEQVGEARRVQEAVRGMTPQLVRMAFEMAERLQKGAQVFFFGNGGSAADAQHWAAELSGRFYQNRASLPALALTTNSSQVTALANDFGYDDVFARPLAGLARSGDVAVGISTSGRSENVFRGLEVARDRGLMTIGFTGASGDKIDPLCDELIEIPSEDVARIQEGHELCGHLLCSVIERVLFGEAVS